MPEHTKEPWDIWFDDEGNFGVVTEHGEFITFAFPNNYFEGGTQEANARRIVDCVNTLAGLNPAALVGLIEAAERICDYNQPRTKEQWDDLREALAALRGAQ